VGEKDSRVMEEGEDHSFPSKFNLKKRACDFFPDSISL
jgi:hypothetical protein